MYTNSVPALISKNVGNALSNHKTWGGIIYNVKEYGAKGTGMGDDTNAIGLAIQAAEDAGGGIVFFPKGTYPVSSLITVNSPVIIQGSGISSILLATATMDKMLSLKSTMIRDIRISGASKADKGISLDGDFCKVYDCLFENCNKSIYNSAFDVHHLIGNSTSGDQYSLYSADRFINCVIERHRCGGTYGLYFTSSLQQPQGIVIQNCLFFGNKDAIKFDTDAYEVEIVNCMMDGLTGIGIDIKGSPSAVAQCYKIMNCFIAPGSGVVGTDTSVGIWIRPGARDVVISGCTIANSTYYGVVIEATASLRCSCVTLRDVKFNNNNRDGMSGDLFADSVEDLLLDGNHLLTVTGTSITLANAVTGGGNGGLSNNVVARPVTVIAGLYDYLNNRGFISANSGTATITAGLTTVVVSHGLAPAITPRRIVLTPRGNTGQPWVTDVDNVHLTINIPTALGANADVSWEAKY